MNDLRRDIQKKLLFLGRDIKNNHISEIYNLRDSKNNLIKTDLLTFDYSKQRINQEVLDYLIQIPELINLKDSLNLLFTEESVTLRVLL